MKNSGGHWTIKLGIQTADPNKRFQSLVFLLKQFHSGQWSSILSAKFDCPVIRMTVKLMAYLLFVCVDKVSAGRRPDSW